MSQTTEDDGVEQLDLTELSEGDTVKMAVQPHGSWRSDRDNVEYNTDIYSTVIEGEITYMPSDKSIEAKTEGATVVADFSVTTDNGDRYTWNLDNGYVIGPNKDGRNPHRTDVARFLGLYE